MLTIRVPCPSDPLNQTIENINLNYGRRRNILMI